MRVVECRMRDESCGTEPGMEGTDDIGRGTGLNGIDQDGLQDGLQHHLTPTHTLLPSPPQPCLNTTPPSTTPRPTSPSPQPDPPHTTPYMTCAGSVTGGARGQYVLVHALSHSEHLHLEVQATMASSRTAGTQSVVINDNQW